MINSFHISLYIEDKIIILHTIMSQKKKLFLLGRITIYRAYFAFVKNPRINSKGLDTSAILVLQILLLRY